MASASSTGNGAATTSASSAADGTGAGTRRETGRKDPDTRRSTRTGLAGTAAQLRPTAGSRRAAGSSCPTAGGYRRAEIVRSAHRASSRDRTGHPSPTPGLRLRAAGRARQGSAPRFATATSTEQPRTAVIPMAPRRAAVPGTVATQMAHRRSATTPGWDAATRPQTGWGQAVIATAQRHAAVCRTGGTDPAGAGAVMSPYRTVGPGSAWDPTVGQDLERGQGLARGLDKGRTRGRDQDSVPGQAPARDMRLMPDAGPVPDRGAARDRWVTRGPGSARGRARTRDPGSGQGRGPTRDPGRE